MSSTPQFSLPKMTHRSRMTLLMVLLFGLVGGCQPPQSAAPQARMDLQFSPSPPTVGDVQLTLKIADAAGAPLAGAEVTLEGNMNHAGMTPSFATLTEAAPGEYTGTLKFTMGGDWFLLVSAKTQQGALIEQKIDVAGVKSH